LEVSSYAGGWAVELTPHRSSAAAQPFHAIRDIWR
jgi:hypothetical protein